MTPETKIIEVTADNLSEYPQVICFINPKHPYYPLKIQWLKERFREGLQVKLLFLPQEKRPVGFIEYVPGEYCWRAVDAKGYMFIHCLYTNGKKYQHQGLGRSLIEEVEKDAGNMKGVAAVTSDKSFMASRDIFIKNGYSVIAESGKDQLLSKSFQDGDPPTVNNWQAALEQYQKLTMIYSKQCPWVARFMEEVKPVLKAENLKADIMEITTPAGAQKAPSLYSVFNLIYQGRLLADRYISVTRLKNIIKKELTCNNIGTTRKK